MDPKSLMAFPTLSSTNAVDEDGRERHVQQHYSIPGMTLRDYFAAKAMAGMIADPTDTNEAHTIAERAYHYADAMLKAREAK